MAARAEQPAGDLPSRRARLPAACARARAGARPGVSPDGRAPPPDRARVPDPHPAGGAGGPGPPGPPHGHRAAARRRGPTLRGRAPARDHARAPGLPRVLRGAPRGRRGAGAHPELHRAQGDRLRGSGPRPPEPAPGPRRPSARPVPGRGGPRDRPALPDAARRALAEPGSRRGARPVRALRLGGGPAHRLPGSPRGPARAARQPGATLRSRRAAHRAAREPARAAQRAREPGDLRGPQGGAPVPGRAGPGARAAARGGGATRPAPAAQAGPGAGHHLADVAGSDRRRALLARDDRPGRGRAGGGVDARPRRDRGRMGRAPRRARAPGSRHHRRPRQARRPRADHRLRSRSLRGLRR